MARLAGRAGGGGRLGGAGNDDAVLRDFPAAAAFSAFSRPRRSISSRILLTALAAVVPPYPMEAYISSRELNRTLCRTWGSTSSAVMAARELARDKDGALPNRR